MARKDTRGRGPASVNYSMEDNTVDGWIDMLPRQEPDIDNNGNIPAFIAANRWLMNQNLPIITIPQYSGDALKWVDFITHFKEMIHEQPYLTTAQRMTYLMQYLEGEAKKSVVGFGNDWSEYIRALKRRQELHKHTSIR